MTLQHQTLHENGVRADAIRPEFQCGLCGGDGLADRIVEKYNDQMSKSEGKCRDKYLNKMSKPKDLNSDKYEDQMGKADDQYMEKIEDHVCGVGDEQVEFPAEELQTEEARLAKKIRDPQKPSREEVEAHNLTHLPYRNWCEACVKGRGVEMDHGTAQKDDDGIHEFHMDFCFPGEEDDSGMLTVLVVRERRTKMLMATVVPSKSTGEFVGKRVVAFMREVGCRGVDVVVKSDNEPAMVAIVNEVIRIRAAEDGMARTIPETSPRKSSKSNGVVERAVRSVEAQMRVMRASLEKRWQTKISVKSSVWPWLCEYGALLLNRCEVGRDGKTSYERCKGKSAKLMGIEFGEEILWRRKPLGNHLAKLACLWENGVFLGVKATSGELVVGDAKGVWTSRTIHRRPVSRGGQGVQLG